MDQVSEFLKNVTLLHDLNRANIQLIEQTKQILAVQWLLGNIGILATVATAIVAYRFALKGVKAYAPKGYKLPSRWFYAMIISAALAMILYNSIPHMMPATANLSPEVEQLINEYSEKNDASSDN